MAADLLPTQKSAALVKGGRDAAARTPCALGDLRFRALLPTAAWRRLPAAVRRRFSKRLERGATALYVGRVTAARHSALGWLLAQALRPLGGPLPFGIEPGTAASVAVTEDADGGGQVWTRLYARRRGFPQVIHSAKRFSGPTGLEEHMGWGLGMALTLQSDARALVFSSDHYFLKLGPLAPTPACLADAGALPGQPRRSRRQGFRL